MRVLAILPFILLVGEALAQDAQLAKARACAGIPDNAARLACFDAALATKAPEPPAATFGLPKPDETPDMISMPVAKIETGADGKLRFTLQDGQVWRQTDSIRLANLGKGPWTAEVHKAAMGSFMLKVDGRTAVRVKRIE